MFKIFISLPFLHLVKLVIRSIFETSQNLSLVDSALLSLLQNVFLKGGEIFHKYGKQVYVHLNRFHLKYLFAKHDRINFDLNAESLCISIYRWLQALSGGRKVLEGLLKNPLHQQFSEALFCSICFLRNCVSSSRSRALCPNSLLHQLYINPSMTFTWETIRNATET